MENRIMPQEPAFDIAKTSLKDLVSHLKFDFDLDVSYVLHLADDKKSQECDRLRMLYLTCCANAKASFNQAKEYVAEAEFETHRIPKEENLKAFDQTFKEGASYGYHQRRWSSARQWCFGITLLAFAAAILITGVSLLFN